MKLNIFGRGGMAEVNELDGEYLGIIDTEGDWMPEEGIEISDSELENMILADMSEWDADWTIPSGMKKFLKIQDTTFSDLKTEYEKEFAMKYESDDDFRLALEAEWRSDYVSGGRLFHSNTVSSAEPVLVTDWLDYLH